MTKPRSNTTPVEARAPYFVVLGLGANLGDRLANLRAATRMLEELGALSIGGRSGVYETAPAGGPPQPHYLNAAVRGQTVLAPEPLLEAALAVERALGRVRPDSIRWGPRTIDIDLLWMSTGSYCAPALTVPHPRLCERPFALRPLLDLVPDAHDPHTRTPYASLDTARCAIQRVASL